MRVTADDLRRNVGDHVAQRELAAFGRDLRLKNDLQQQVAQLFLQPLRFVQVDGFERLVGLFEQVAAQGLGRLLPIPGAAILGRAQVRDQLGEGLQAARP